MSSNGEYEKGRKRRDSVSSASSQESTLKRKRPILDPQSGDESDTAPIADDDDDTPSPAPAGPVPLIRQSIAFGSGPININTYQATPASPAKPDAFLPGQVPVPLTPPQDITLRKEPPSNPVSLSPAPTLPVTAPDPVASRSPTATANKPAPEKVPKKKKRKPNNKAPDENPGMARWRLDSYDNVPSAPAQREQRGTGPYNSLYRASVETKQPNENDVEMDHFPRPNVDDGPLPTFSTFHVDPSPSIPHEPRPSSASSSNADASRYYRHDYNSPSNFGNEYKPPPKKSKNRNKNAPAAPAPAAASTAAPAPPPMNPYLYAIQTGRVNPQATQGALSPNAPGTAHGARMIASPNPHNPHAASFEYMSHSNHPGPSDYNANSAHSHSKNINAHTAERVISSASSFTIDISSGKKVPPSQSEPSASAVQAMMARRRERTRMVTVLIHDVRSGIEDCQLAEVRIPINPADEEGVGYWADAKDIADELQAGPSRIDGPAKVYTFRGKYRQIFLLVSEENMSQSKSSNVVISPQQTIDIIVELPKAPTIPPSIPQELRPSRSRSVEPDDPMEPTEEEIDQEMEAYYHSKAAASRKPQSDFRRDRRRSHTFEDFASLSPEKYVSNLSNERGSSAVRFEHHFATNYSLSTPPPQSDPDSEKTLASIVDRVASQINEDPTFEQFYKARSWPPSVAAILQQYKLVERLFNTYVGKKVAFRSTDRFKIAKKHIAAALKIQDPEKYVADCCDTLRLIELYGADGSRERHERIKERMKDNTTPAPNANPIKRFLKDLYEIDRVWCGQNGSEPISRPRPPSSSTSSGKKSLFM